jgi:hypothetical protein
MLSERSEAKKNKYHLFSLIYEAKKTDLIEVKNRIVATRNWERQEGEGYRMLNGHRDAAVKEECLLLFYNIVGQLWLATINYTFQNS